MAGPIRARRHAPGPCGIGSAVLSIVAAMLQPCDARITVTHLTTAQIESGLDHVRQSPADGGILQMIVRRPRVDERELLATAELDRAVGLVGDTWKDRKSRRTPDGSPH